MLERVWRLFGMTGDSASPQAEYDPVYGLPKWAVQEWLARNPRLREQYEVEEWLAHNPPLREEYEVAERQRKAALGVGDGSALDKTSLQSHYSDRLS